MSKGRVLSEEELCEWEKLISEMPTCIDFASATECADLIATVRDRDKTIAEKDAALAELRGIYDLQYGAMIQHLKRENEWLHQKLDAYERVVEAARHWRETQIGGKWRLGGGRGELLGLLRTKQAREEALIRAVDALESDVE